MASWWKGTVIGVAAAGIATCSAAALAQQDWRNSPAVQQLYEAAKKEGEVVVWGTAGREVDWLPAAFSKAFPGINVRVQADNDVTTKAIAEARAGRHAVDLMSSSLSLVRPLSERGLIEPNDWAIFGVSPEYIVYDGKMAYTHSIAYVIAYNNKLVKPEDVPTKWEQILDPKYKGKAVGQQFLFSRMVGALALEWGEEKTTQFARDVRDNAGVMLTSAPRESFLQSGERLYAYSEVDSFPKQWARDGVPVSYVIPEPVMTAQFGVVLMKNAPHPNAARLMSGWMVSPEGRKAREEIAFQVDFTPTSSNPEARKIYDSGATVILDTPELLAKRDELIKKIAPIVAGQAR